MNLLDENIRHDQGERLRQSRIKFRFLIQDFAESGIQDPDILPLLHRIKCPTLFSHDRDYFHRALAHRAYCLAWLDVFDGDAALFIRRFLRHPEFHTHAKRMGKVVRIHSGRLNYWQIGRRTLLTADWV